MLRGVLVIIIAGTIAWGSQKLFASPGMVTIQWQGYEIVTSAAFVLTFILALAFLSFWSGGMWTLLVSTPGWLKKKVQWQRQEKAIDIFTAGLEAAKLGDLKRAQKQAKKVKNKALSAVLYAELGDIQHLPALTGGQEQGHVLVLLTRMKAAEQQKEWVLLKSLALQAYGLKPKSGEILDALFVAHLALGEKAEAVQLAPALRAATIRFTQEELDEKFAALYVALASADVSVKVKQRYLQKALKEHENDVQAMLAYAQTLSDPEKKLISFWQQTGDFRIFESLCDGIADLPEKKQLKKQQNWLKKAPTEAARLHAAMGLEITQKNWDEALTQGKALEKIAPTPALYRTLADIEENRGSGAARVNLWLKKALLPKAV